MFPPPSAVRGARYVCDSSAVSFLSDLTEALTATGATLAFDALGGGKMAAQILACMEAAINKTAKAYSRYGSSVHKQVYIYGGLDRGPTELTRNFGLAWGLGGWLLTPFLAISVSAVARLISSSAGWPAALASRAWSASAAIPTAAGLMTCGP